MTADPSAPSNVAAPRVVSRRVFCASGALALAAPILAPLSACTRSAKPARLVLYCSADAEYAIQIIGRFQERVGVQVDPVFDTEATKTTGLVNRLLAEKSRPRADVWWSSEPLGTIRLARAGVFAPYRSSAAEASLPGGWPAVLKDDSATPLWYAFGDRARVFVRNTRIVPEADAPRTLDDLLHPRFAGRVGIARPQFGTTRGHMAAALATRGEAAFVAWLRGLRSANVRLLDGNAAVARAVATGELHIGLTDSDDVFAGQAQGWPIELSFERPPPEPTLVLIPNTVARIAGNPAGDAAHALVDYLLSADAQRALALTPSRNLPVDPDLRRELGGWYPSDLPPQSIAMARIADHVEPAIALCERELGA